MPWTHCGAEVNDDASCPGCGLTKEQWTIQFDAVRTFRVARRAATRVAVLLDDGADTPLEGEPFRLAPAEGEPTEGHLDDLGTAALGGGGGRFELPEVPRPRLVSVEPAEAVADDAEDAPVRVALVAGARHVVRVRRALDLVCKRLDAARDGAPWRVTFDDGTELEGRLEEGGRLHALVPPAATSARVLVGDAADPADVDEYDVELGALAPAREPRGLQQRLNNLGYGCGLEDGELGPVTRAALARFQRKLGLDPTGEPDDATLARLVEAHRH